MISVSFFTGASPRNCFRQCSTACFISFSAHSAVFAFIGRPVGRTMRNESMKASSIGPCRPGFLRAPSGGAKSHCTHFPSTCEKSSDRLQVPFGAASIASFCAVDLDRRCAEVAVLAHCGHPARTE